MTRRKQLAAAVLIVVMVVGLYIADRGDGREPVPRSPLAVQLVDGHGLGWWVRRARANRRAVLWQRKRAEGLERRLAVTVAPLQHRYEYAAELAAAAFGVDAGTLIRKGRCESAGWTAFTNASSGAAGPWQFLWSTWRSTPLGSFSPYDPLAAGLAAAWMHAQGRGNEWSCR